MATKSDSVCSLLSVSISQSLDSVNIFILKFTKRELNLDSGRVSKPMVRTRSRVNRRRASDEHPARRL
jgi:hypothetical protein